MPKIVSSTILRNEYNDVSLFCHLKQEPIFITKNGQGDLAVLSIEKYEEIFQKIELYKKLYEGLNDFESGNIKPYREIRNEILDA